MEHAQKADRIGGVITILFGFVSIIEAVRLYPNRISSMEGDHILPGLVGILMILLGLWLLIMKGETFRVEYPKGKMLVNMIIVIAIMFAYWFAIPFLGYVISTLVAFIVLFRALGSYHWFKCTLYGVLSTLCIYMLFIYWLNMPFPTGIFDI